MKPKHFTDFYTEFHQYISSDEFLSQSECLSHIPFAHNILTSVMFVLQTNVLKSSASTSKPTSCFQSVFPSASTSTSPGGRGKIRYVGGYCITKCKYHMSCRMRNSLFAPGMEKEICKMSKQLTLLDEMTTSSTEIYISTKYENTLTEISRKQNRTN